MATASGSYNFKIVLLGEGCVGKTSCVLRYVDDRFNDKHLTTLLDQTSCHKLHNDLKGFIEHLRIDHIIAPYFRMNNLMT